MKHMSMLTAFMILFVGCKDEQSSSPVIPGQSTTTESDLFLLGQSPAGFIFYKNSTDTISKATGSGHPDPRLRTRYNSVAAAYLDANGKVKTGTIFPDSSLIVKELYTNNVLTTYVFLFKKSGDKNADANGWIWAETSPTGSATYPVANKGAGCIGCHSVGIDYTRMNDAHP